MASHDTTEPHKALLCPSTPVQTIMNFTQPAQAMNPTKGRPRQYIRDCWLRSGNFNSHSNPTY